MFYINSQSEVINLNHIIKLYLKENTLLAMIDTVDSSKNVHIITVESGVNKNFLDTFNFFIMRGKSFTNHDVLGYMN